MFPLRLLDSAEKKKKKKTLARCCTRRYILYRVSRATRRYRPTGEWRASPVEFFFRKKENKNEKIKHKNKNEKINENKNGTRNRRAGGWVNQKSKTVGKNGSSHVRGRPVQRVTARIEGQGFNFFFFFHRISLPLEQKWEESAKRALGFFILFLSFGSFAHTSASEGYIFLFEMSFVETFASRWGRRIFL